MRTSLVLIFLSLPVYALEHKEGFYDLVLNNGHVMDPESGLDTIRHIGIKNGKIMAISSDPLEGKEIIDVKGLIVAPGFIDLNVDDLDYFSSCLKVLDGVTTALKLENGAFPISVWYNDREGKSLFHFGTTVSQIKVRLKIIPNNSSAIYEKATPAQISQILTTVEKELNEGALGIGYGIQYTPGASREEIFRLFQLSTKYQVTNFVHMRSAGQTEPGVADALQEMIANAAMLNASVHVVHITSNGGWEVPFLLEMIDHAQQKGLDVTTEMYPYAAWSTNLKTAIFEHGWQERYGGSYHDIEWLATGERLTEKTFNQYQSQGGMIIAHLIPESMVRYAIKHPGVIIASDGLSFNNGRAHPRSAGTFARSIGYYSQRQKDLSLMEVLRKMTSLPARHLEKSVKQMQQKGRIKIGADADITIFDAKQILDRATYENPATSSAGIVHVIVGGILVVRDNHVVQHVFPGQAIRRL